MVDIWTVSDYEESQSESEAVSSSRQDALRLIKSPLMSPQSATSETEEESRDGKYFIKDYIIYFNPNPPLKFNPWS